MTSIIHCSEKRPLLYNYIYSSIIIFLNYIFFGTEKVAKKKSDESWTKENLKLQLFTM
jgi:hypothetical protein